MKFTSLEIKFSAELLKRHLNKKPQEAPHLAVNYFEDFSNLALEHKKLLADFEAMQTELIQLQQQNSTLKKLPELPDFLSSIL